MLACLWPLERCARDDRACIFWCDPISSFPALAGNRGAAQAVARPDVLLFSLSSSPVLSLPLSLRLSDGGYQFDRLVPIGNGMIRGLWHPPWPVCSTVQCDSMRVHPITLFFRHTFLSMSLCVWLCVYIACLHVYHVCARACEWPAPSCKASNEGCLVNLSCFRTVISESPPLLLIPSVRNWKNQNHSTHTSAFLSLSVSFFLFHSISLSPVV